jgi:hypothetical protein
MQSPCTGFGQPAKLADGITATPCKQAQKDYIFARRASNYSMLFVAARRVIGLWKGQPAENKMIYFCYHWGQATQTGGLS